MGALTALYRNKPPDIVIMFAVILCISIPSFVFAALGQLGLVKINALVGHTLLPVAGCGQSHMIVRRSCLTRHDGISDAVDALVDARDRQRGLRANGKGQRPTDHTDIPEA